MSISQDKSEAIIGYYEILSETNPSYNKKIILRGLDESILYSVNGEYEAYGDELMNVGIVFEQPDRYFSYESATRDFRGEIIKITRVKK